MYITYRNKKKIAKLVHDTVWQVVMREKEGKDFVPFDVAIDNGGFFPRVLVGNSDSHNSLILFSFTDIGEVYNRFATRYGIMEPERIMKRIRY